VSDGGGGGGGGWWRVREYASRVNSTTFNKRSQPAKLGHLTGGTRAGLLIQITI
jgi:hypothetical protein